MALLSELQEVGSGACVNSHFYNPAFCCFAGSSRVAREDWGRRAITTVLGFKCPIVRPTKHSILTIFLAVLEKYCDTDVALAFHFCNRGELNMIHDLVTKSV